MIRRAALYGPPAPGLYLPQPLGGALQGLILLGEAEAQDRRRLRAIQERRRRDRGDAVLLREPHGEVGIALRRNLGVVHQLEVAAVALQRTEPRSFHQL